MPNRKKLFIYLGPHRSGSHFLNEYIAPNLGDVYATFSRDRTINTIILSAMESHPLFFDPAPARERILARLADVGEDIVLVNSAEFFGDYGRFNSDRHYISQPFYDNPRRAQVLRDIFDCPDFDPPKVIMSMRRQDTWVESAYMHFIHNYRTSPFDRFVAPGTDNDFRISKNQRGHPGVDWRSLDWSIYLQNYIDTFGAENVLVLPFEMGTQELKAYLERLYDFMQCERYFPESAPLVNHSLSETALKIALVLGRFVRQKDNPLGFIPDQPFAGWLRDRRAKGDNKLLWALAGISRRINLFWFLRHVVSRYNYKRPDLLGPERRRQILDYYRDSNKKYAEIIGVDLSKYGYY
ncbi:MAG: hypothetical protein ACFE0S_09790 [Rhodospirillales bacterium]